MKADIQGGAPGGVGEPWSSQPPPPKRRHKVLAAFAQAFVLLLTIAFIAIALSRGDSFLRAFGSGSDKWSVLLPLVLFGFISTVTFLAAVRFDVLSRPQFAQQQVALFDWALLPSLQFAILVVTYRWWAIMWLAAPLGLFIGFVLWMVTMSSTAGYSATCSPSPDSRSCGCGCGAQDPYFIAADRQLASALHIQLHMWPGGHDFGYWNAHWSDYLGFYAHALATCG